MTKILGKDLEELNCAIADAFPNPSDLREFARYYLDINLYDATSPGSLRAMVFELVVHMESIGRLDDLLRCLTEVRPASQRIQTIVAKIHVGDSVAPRISLPRVQRILGRQTERDSLVLSLLYEGGAAVCLCGPPGVGKSTLALAVLNDSRVATRFGVQRWFVRLDGVSSGISVWGEIRNAMGLLAGRGARESVIWALSNGGVIVLDHFESIWDDDRDGAARVLRDLANLPSVSLLVTMRGRAVLPLDISWHEHNLATLPRHVSRQLFGEIAGVEADKNSAIDDALEQLADLPLGIVLLAGLARTVGVESAIHMWRTQSTDVLRADEGVIDGRHRSWLQVLKASLDSPAFPAAARAMARWLAALPDGVADEDLPVIGGEGAPMQAASLIQVGLAFWDGPERHRLRMLAPIREGVATLLMADSASFEQAAAFYVSRARADSEKIGTESGADAAQRMGKDISNIEIAIRWMINQQRWDDVAAGVSALAKYISFTGNGDAAWVPAVVKLIPESEVDFCTQVLLSCAHLFFARSEYKGAKQLFQRAMTLCEKTESSIGKVICLQYLGDIALRESDLALARQSFEEACAINVAAGDAVGEATCLQCLGDIESRLSRPDKAFLLFNRAKQLCVRTSNVLGEANVESKLGDLALQAGTDARATTHYLHAQSLYSRVGALRGEASSLKGLGDIARRGGDSAKATELYGKAQCLFAKVGSVRGEAACLLGLGELATAQSDQKTGRAMFERGERLFRKIGELNGEADCVVGLAEVAMLDRDIPTAMRLFERAAGMYANIESSFDEASSLAHLAYLAATTGELDRGLQLYRRALTRYEQVAATKWVEYARDAISAMEQTIAIRQSKDRSAKLTGTGETFEKEESPDVGNMEVPSPIAPMNTPNNNDVAERLREEGTSTGTRSTETRRPASTSPRRGDIVTLPPPPRPASRLRASSLPSRSPEYEPTRKNVLDPAFDGKMVVLKIPPLPSRTPIPSPEISRPAPAKPSSSLWIPLVVGVMFAVPILLFVWMATRFEGR